MSQSGGEADVNYELIKFDYEQSAATYRQLVDVRFKLLAIVPPLSAIGVGLLTESEIAKPVQLAIALWGLVVSLGVVIYDQRNSQLYDGAVGRLQHLECRLGLPKFKDDKHPGLFGSREDQPRGHLFLIRVKHDYGLALIYAAVIGAWAFALVDGLPKGAPIAAPAALAVGVVLLAQLLLWRREAKARRAQEAKKLERQREDAKVSPDPGGAKRR